MVAQSCPPPAAVDSLIDSLLRPKRIGRVSGFAHKPALRRADPDGFVREQVTAVAFGLVLDEMRIANTTIASVWGVSESIVRGVRNRNRPLSYAKVHALPEDLRAALDRKTDDLMDRLRRLRASLPPVDESLRALLPSNDDFTTDR